MELVSGGDLLDRILDKGSYKEDKARKLMRQVLPLGLTVSLVFTLRFPYCSLLVYCGFAPHPSPLTPDPSTRTLGA